MNRILLGLLVLCSYFGSAFALSVDDLPDSFYIKEQKCSFNGCVDLVANEKQIGALRRTPQSLESFDFFDRENQMQVKIVFRKRFARMGLLFDVYNNKQMPLAKLVFLISNGGMIRFDLFALDGYTLLATGSTNYLGTKHTIYLGNTWNILATMTRPLFTWSRNSEVHIMDKSLFASAGDRNVLYAVMALYCFHNGMIKVDTPKAEISTKFIRNLQEKVQKLAAAQSTEAKELKVTAVQMQAAADLLNQRYSEVYDDTNLSDEEKINQFVTFGCDLIQSHTLSLIEEQAILQFLLNRLGS